MSSQPPIGLIAGQGLLPVQTARGILAAGRSVACVGLWGQYRPELPGLCRHFQSVGLIQIGRWISNLRRWGCRQAIMAGGVDKTRMYDPLRVFRYIPDLRAARLWYRTLRHDKRTDALLRALAAEIESCGVHLIDCRPYMPDALATPGPMTRRQPTPAQRAAIDFARPLVQRLGELDIGQSIAVAEGEVLAIEAIEGTDALIRRAGSLCKAGGWVLVKMAKPNQDVRFDLPTVGLQTIAELKAARAGCLALEAGKVILLDKPQVLAAADAAGIAVFGIA